VFDDLVAITAFSGEKSDFMLDSGVTLERYRAPLPEYAIEFYAAA
jgi:hypothetical protein